MATRSLNVVISGDARQLGLATKQADKHMDDTGKSAGRMSSALKVGFGAAAAGAGLLVVGLKQTIDAAMDAEKSNARLQAQLRASGISYRAHAKEIENVIQKTSQLAALDDEDLQDAFTNIVRVTGNVSQSLKLVGLAADFARARHMDVAKAGELVGKVAGGNVGILSRYGLAIKPVTTAVDALAKSHGKVTVEQRRAAAQADKTATAQAALGALQKKFGGQAEAYGKTAAGAQERFQVAVENLKEMLGAGLLPTVTKVTNAVSKFVNEMQTGTGAGGGFARSMRDLKDSIDPVVTATQSVVKWFGRHEKAAHTLATAIGAPMQQLQGLTSILKGLKSAGDAVVSVFKDVAGVIGKVGGVAKGAAGLLKRDGDGLGKVARGGALPSGGAFGGSLMGAQSALKPFAAIGSRFGLNVTSGRRPGSITSSGNISYHSSGEAIDMGDGRGPDANKLNFFKYMKSHFGGRLAELIYTPGGAGVKDGQPHTYTGQVAADHYDHVHVAFDTGRPGVGDGIGFQGLERLWVGGGGSAKMAPLMAHIAQAESRGDPSARNPSGASGLWQILGQPFPGNVFDPATNARMAVWKYEHQGLGAWAASRGTWGRFVGSGETYSPGGSSKGGSGGGSSSGNTASSYSGPTGRGHATGRNTASGIGSTVSGDRTTPKGLAGPGGGGYDQRLADIGLERTQTDDPKKLLLLIYAEGVEKRRRLNKIKRALKRRLKPETRKRLTDEATQLVADLKALSELAFDISGGQGGMKDGVMGGPGVTLDESGNPITDASGNPIAGASGGAPTAADAGTGGDPNQPLIDAINELAKIEQQKIDLETQLQANQLKILAMVNQGPAILGAVVAAANGELGGRVGLGVQTPGYAGAVANYGGSAGRL